MKRMAIWKHRIVVRVVYPLGMLGGFAIFSFVIWFAVAVIGVSPPRNSVWGVVMVFVEFALFFAFVYRGGRLAVSLLQWRLRASCPRCGRAEVGLKFVTFTKGLYQCRNCGYVHPERGAKDPIEKYGETPTDDRAPLADKKKQKKPS